MQGRGVAILHNDCAGAKSGSRPDDSPEVVRVRDLVEEDQAAGPFGPLEHTCDVLLLKGKGVQGKSLMDGVLGQNTVNGDQVRLFDLGFCLARQPQDLRVCPRAGQEFPAFSGRIPQGCCHGMGPPQPDQVALWSPVAVGWCTVSVSVSGHSAAPKVGGT
jgi:hypothetical protein